MNKLTYVFVISFGVTIILKILNMIYNNYQRQYREIKQDNVFNLINPQVSYSDFEKIAKETLRLNSPMRTQDDFLDFFIENIDSENQKYITELLSVEETDA